MANEKINIVVIEDNKELCTLLEAYFEKDQHFQFLGAAYNAEDGLALIDSKEPDMVLIDIILPFRDGLSVLEELSKRNADQKPICIMLTGVSSEGITHKAMSLGAEYIFLKPFEWEIMARRLVQIYESKVRSFQTSDTPQNESFGIPPISKSTQVEEHLTQLLIRFGIAVHLKGYKYVRRAILLCIEDEYMLEGTTKILYPAIAKEYKSTVMSVEHGIRNALTAAWSKECAKNYYRILGIEDLTGKRPSNSAFISNIVDYFNIKIIRKM